jgi:hypothetical protein
MANVWTLENRGQPGTRLEGSDGQDELSTLLACGSSSGEMVTWLPGEPREQWQVVVPLSFPCDTARLNFHPVQPFLLLVPNRATLGKLFPQRWSPDCTMVCGEST